MMSPNVQKNELSETYLGGIQIPPQPQILLDLKIEQESPAPDIRKIAHLISQDVGMCGAVLKVVNSSAYGLRNEVTSVTQAVNFLGGDRVITLVNGLAIRMALSDERITQLSRFWDMASDIAAMSAEIARQIYYEDIDQAYLLGLFHNCGIPLLAVRHNDYFEVIERSYANPSPRIIDVENEAYQTNHAVIGYYTARSWKLPQTICNVIADHHTLEPYFTKDKSVGSREKTLMAILKMAERICGDYKVLGGQEEDHEWQEYGDKILYHMGLTSYDLEQLEMNHNDY